MTRQQGLIWQHAGGQGVLFDCDGVLVDSDASVERAWRRWTDEYGLPVHQVLDIAGQPDPAAGTGAGFVEGHAVNAYAWRRT